MSKFVINTDFGDKSAEENQCDNCIHAAVCRFEEPEYPCGYFEPKRETEINNKNSLNG